MAVSFTWIGWQRTTEGTKQSLSKLFISGKDRTDMIHRGLFMKSTGRRRIMKSECLVMKAFFPCICIFGNGVNFFPPPCYLL